MAISNLYFSKRRQQDHGAYIHSLGTSEGNIVGKNADFSTDHTKQPWPLMLSVEVSEVHCKELCDTRVVR